MTEIWQLPFDVIVAEVCKDEGLNDFREENHGGPQPIPQSCQQASTRIQNLKHNICLHFL